MTGCGVLQEPNEEEADHAGASEDDLDLPREARHPTSKRNYLQQHTHPDIFDDTDHYQELLRELSMLRCLALAPMPRRRKRTAPWAPPPHLGCPTHFLRFVSAVERRTNAAALDPTEMGRQYVEIDRLRAKLKRRADTKASKGMVPAQPNPPATRGWG